MPKTESTEKKNKPAATFRMGTVKATVWANEANGKTFYSVTFSRGYKDEAGKWHDADSFGRDDLPRVEKLAAKTYEWIFAESAKKNAEDAE